MNMEDSEAKLLATYLTQLQEIFISIYLSAPFS